MSESLAGLYVPPDVEDAAARWGANCGPCAIAAVTATLIDRIRRFLEPFSGHMSPTEVQFVLRSLGWHAVAVNTPHRRGLAFVQWCGPWEKFTRAAYRHTHWIAYRMMGDAEDLGNIAFYDVNVGDAGGWISGNEWDRTIVPELLPAKATGWRVRLWLEVARG